jgi:hypothetical protein
VAAIVLGVGGGTFALASDLTGSDRSHAAIERLPRLISKGVDHPYVRAFGLDPSAARYALSTQAGVAIALTRNTSAACILADDGDDQCFEATHIRSGRGYVIRNNCSGSKGSMRIMGVVPEGAASVRVRYSSGPGLSARVHEGIFVIEDTTPDAGAAYPTKIEFVSDAGDMVAADEIPGGDDLCMRRSQ